MYAKGEISALVRCEGSEQCYQPECQKFECCWHDVPFPFWSSGGLRVHPSTGSGVFWRWAL